MIYVMSDIHGYFDKFISILERINFSDEDELYILGDVIDRGDKPIETLKFVLEQKNMHLLMGNHEQIMLDSFAFSADEVCPTRYASNWMSVGGFITADQFLNLSVNEQIDLLLKISKLPSYIIKDNNIFVHAGIPENKPIRLEGNRFIYSYMEGFDKDDLIWDRDMIYTDFKIEGFHVYCGHNPTPYAFPNHYGIYKTDGYTLIDCGVYLPKGKLACYCIDDGSVIYE
jgi:serine/threonine protein phosphatase 1